MYKTKKKEGVKIKTWWLLLNTPRFRLQKTKHKNKNELIVVFIEFIYHCFIHFYLFFLKYLCVFQPVTTKKQLQ